MTFILLLPLIPLQESVRLVAMEMAVAEAANAEVLYEQEATEQLAKQAEAEEDERRFATRLLHHAILLM